MYKQLIIARRDLNMSPGKLAAQVSHASMAFLTTALRQSAVERYPDRYLTTYADGISIQYIREDFAKWAKEARDRGEKYFCAVPVDPNDKYGEFKLCPDIVYYNSEINFTKGLYEGWIDGSFTKVVCGARNKNKLMKAIEKAQELGMKEGKDYFIIRDACRTELKPEENGTTITCIGFVPMEDKIIDKIGKEYNLF